MSTIYTKLMAATGTTACLGVSLLPLGAATAATTANVTLSATVAKIVSISTAGSVSPAQSLVAGGDTTTVASNVTVATNSTSGYTLTVVASGADNSLHSGINIIPATSNVNPVAKGNSAWGITASATSGTISSPYNNASAPAAVPTSTAALVKTYNSDTASDITTITYHFSAAVTQPSGTYTGGVVYTVNAL